MDRIASSCVMRFLDGALDHLDELRHHRRVALDRPLSHGEGLWQAQQVSWRQGALDDAAAPRCLERGR